MNPGKQFEKDFQSSAGWDIEIERLKDAAGWSDGENTRFTPSNIADFVLYDGNSEKKELFYVELKSYKGKSIPFGNFNIKHLVKLEEKAKKIGVRSIVVFNPRDIEKVYYADAADVTEYMLDQARINGRKSIPLEWIQSKHEVQGEKKKIHFKYDLTSITRR